MWVCFFTCSQKLCGVVECALVRAGKPFIWTAAVFPGSVISVNFITFSEPLFPYPQSYLAGLLQVRQPFCKGGRQLWRRLLQTAPAPCEHSISASWEITPLRLLSSLYLTWLYKLAEGHRSLGGYCAGIPALPLPLSASLSWTVK